MHNKKLKDTKNDLHRSSFSKTSLLAFLVIFAAVGGFILWKTLAAPNPPAIYLTQATLVKGPSSTFSVQLRENSGTTNVNAIQANLSYPTTLLTLTSIDYTGSAFTTQAQSVGASGVINIARGQIGGVVGDQLVATLNFTTTTTGGTASVPFTSGTALVESTNNTNLITSLSTMTVGGSYTTDTVAPTVSITAPANGATLAGGGLVNLTVNATDASSSVSKVEYYIDGALKGSSTTSPFSFSWNTSGVALGSHTVQAKAYDTFNNVGTSTTVTVNLADQSPPTAPTSLRTTATALNSIALAWNASTDNVGVTSYKLSRNGTLITTLSGATLAYTDSGLVAGTSYNYSLQALDAANNTSPAATLAASTQALKPGDLNSDNTVDAIDLSILLSDYGTTNAAGDVNKDGKVDITDLSILISHYGT